VANTAQARKRAEQAKRHRDHNMAQRSKMRTYIKKVVAEVKAGNVAKAAEDCKLTIKTVDSMVSKGLIHKNKAARHKSRLSAQLKKAATK
jgi:small subunit ribosomal protein S20